MNIIVLTPDGPQLVDVSTLDPETQRLMGLDLCLRVQELLANSPPLMSMPDMQELIRILCQFTGLAPPPAP